MTIFLFLIVNIIIHELSHLYFCLKFKCKVNSIYLGFGKPIFKFVFKQIPVYITPILIGGYVSVKGEEKHRPGKYAICNLKLSQKIIIGTAGCLSNLILGLIMVWVVYILTNNYNILLLGYLSIILGIMNLLPIPSLDGGFITWYLLFIKILGKKQGIKIYNIVSKICFGLLIVISIISIFIYLYLK